MTTTDRASASSASSPTSAPARDRRQVYIEASVLLVEEPADDRRQGPRHMLAPGAADAVALLKEGHDVLMVDPADGDGATLAGLASTPAVPESCIHGSWYITGDEAWCEGHRPNGLRSILVGPKRPPARRPTLRCDLEARDLNAAVMEILVRETMA